MFLNYKRAKIGKVEREKEKLAQYFERNIQIVLARYGLPYKVERVGDEVYLEKLQTFPEPMRPVEIARKFSLTYTRIWLILKDWRKKVLDMIEEYEAIFTNVKKIYEQPLEVKQNQNEQTNPNNNQ